MILTNATARPVTLNPPKWLDEPTINVPAGGTASAPDSLWPHVEMAALSLGLTVSFGGGAGTPVVDNFTATTAPTINDDTSLGYKAGSHWLDTLTGKMYVASSVVVGSAVWVMVDKGVKNNFTATTAPTTAADSTQNYGIGSVWIDTVTGNVYTATDVTPAAAAWTAGAASPLSSTFDTINIAAPLLAPSPLTVPTINTGINAVTFNGSTIVVLLNGLEQVKGVDVSWQAGNAISFNIDLFIGDVVVVKP